MDSCGTKDLESFKNNGENISSCRSSMIEAEESASGCYFEESWQENDAKANPVSLHGDSGKCHVELTQSPTKAHDKSIDSVHQFMDNTEKLDPKPLPDEAGHSTPENSDLRNHHTPNTGESDFRLPQYAGESNTGKKDPISQQKSRTKGCDSSFIVENGEKSNNLNLHISNINICESISHQTTAADHQEGDLDASSSKEEKFFYYETPLHEETGSWIPISVPPMNEHDREEWTRGFCSNVGYIAESDMGWNECIGEDKELTMWDVVVEMLLVARGKLDALASGDIAQIAWISSTQFIEQAWKDMAQTLTEANFCNTKEILESEPPKWLPDSTASSCMLCSVRFHPIMCTRHHCRFCGGIFCSECTKGRSLLPEKFRTADPQRVCDVCCVRLESVQPYLMNQVSRAAQFPTHDLTDLSTLRSWVNFPWGQSMEYEIYKAANTIRSYSKIGSFSQEKRIPEAILRDAKGLAIVTVVKVGMMVTYNVGTGVVVARREDGLWSPPSAISSFGVGWGAQAGGELIDFIIVLRTYDAVRTFCHDAHFSVGAGLSAAVGIIGRTAEADLRAGASGLAACYTYSCSKGAFIGCSLEGSVVTTRARENYRFYGSQSLDSSEILLGSLPQPPAASALYRALGDLFLQVER
ncbi:hypothetical protein ACS0TY_031519 [Phlomoides rotata]